MKIRQLSRDICCACEQRKQKKRQYVKRIVVLGVNKKNRIYSGKSPLEVSTGCHGCGGRVQHPLSYAKVEADVMPGVGVINCIRAKCETTATTNTSNYS